MGRIAGAAHARSEGLTLWALSLADLPSRVTDRMALVLPSGAIADWTLLPEHPLAGTSRQRRSIGRRQVLGALTSRLDGRGDRLVADHDGVRRLADSTWFASVAERSGWFAAVVARTPIGIDLESEVEAAAGADVALAGVVSIDRVMWPSLAAVWAAREATLKALGRDLTRDPGDWRFGTGTATVSGCASHQVDVHAFDGMVAAVAYAGT